MGHPAESLSSQSQDAYQPRPPQPQRARLRNRRVHKPRRKIEPVVQVKSNCSAVAATQSKDLAGIDARHEGLKANHYRNRNDVFAVRWKRETGHKYRADTNRGEFEGSAADLKEAALDEEIR
jgi:hypothetical protein